MKYCWSYVDDQVGLASPALGVFCVLCTASILREAMQSVAPLKYLLIAGAVFLPILTISFVVSFVCARRYQIDSNGMTIIYPFGITSRYSWEDFSEVALCKVHYASASNAHIVAIRCVVGEEKRGPRTASVAKETWSRPEYEILHFRRIISIYKTDARISEFHRLCPHPLKDYRNLPDPS